MGLDMYLYAERYFSSYSHSKDESSQAYAAILKDAGLEEIVAGQDDSPHLEVRACVMYWRKANAIHGWFVRECQDGKDECQYTYVDRDKLRELLQLCKLAGAYYDTGDLTEAGNTLTPVGGFFFGSTDVDQWWREDVQRTIDGLERILAIKGAFDFYYRSSW